MKVKELVKLWKLFFINKSSRFILFIHKISFFSIKEIIIIKIKNNVLNKAIQAPKVLILL